MCGDVRTNSAGGLVAEPQMLKLCLEAMRCCSTLSISIPDGGVAWDVDHSREPQVAAGRGREESGACMAVHAYVHVSDKSHASPQLTSAQLQLLEAGWRTLQ